MYPTFVTKPLKNTFWLPLSIVHQSQTTIVPSYFSEVGEQKQQPLEVQDKQPSFFYLLNFYYPMESIILAALQKLLPSDQWTHQEAHKVEDKDSWHPAERQALQHWAANLGWVTVVLGQDCGCWSVAALRWGAPLDPSHGHYEHKYSVTLNSRFTTCRNNTCWLLFLKKQNWSLYWCPLKANECKLGLSIERVWNITVLCGSKFYMLYICHRMWMNAK